MTSFITRLTCILMLVIAAAAEDSSNPSPSTAQKQPAESPSATMAGPQAEQMCKALAENFKPDGLTINNTFSQYFPEGTNPSIELLAQMYPPGTIPKGTKLANIFDLLGPDADIVSDSGYGKSQGRAARNGPVGGLPAFCRFGAFVITSPVTVVLSEVWMPLSCNPDVPVTAVNASDFPQNTTSFLIGQDGQLERVPLFVKQGKTDKPDKPQPGAKSPPAPNDYPDPAKPDKADATTKAKTVDKTGDDKLPTTELDDDDGNDTTATKNVDKPNVDDKEGKNTTLASRGLQSHGHCSDTGLHRRQHSGHHDAIGGDDVLGRGDAWNGRLVVQGNGGQRGFVPFPDMKLLMSRYRFAVAGTNLGHFSASNAVTWVNGTHFKDTLLDFGSRANHVTLQLAEQVLAAYYGPTAGVRSSQDKRVRSYYVASSVGAARGLSAMEVYPGDFHGLLLGPPAARFMNMNVGQLRTAALHNKTVIKDGFFTQGALVGPIKDIVLEQCDALDGVKDGVISSIFTCKPDITKQILCGGSGRYSSSNGTCLTQIQIAAFHKLYTDTILDGKVVYPGYLPGFEDSASSLNAMNSKASGWTQLVVYKLPSLNSSFNPFTDIRYDDLARGNEEDPGGVNAQATDYSEFVKLGGKMLMAQGMSDFVVSPTNTIQLYENIIKTTSGASGKPAQDALKLYMVPGMRHSRGGQGAWNYGGASQTDAGSRPLDYTTQHDMLLALVRWVEGDAQGGGHDGTLPRHFVAAAYKTRAAVLPTRGGASDGGGPNQDLKIPTSFQNYNWGLRFTRPLCPWPQMPKYKGGNPGGAEGFRAFECK